ncbi:MAG: hypothetical protein OSJ44_16090, partial [Lachnospiraceae bacterium]|nr:hypothetical protein [Lachnospiraceae bacterium]
SVKESCSLVFFQQEKTEPVQTVPLLPEDKIGDVWNITLEGDFRGLAYAYLFDGVLCEDPYGKHFSGRENWGEKHEGNRVLHALLSEKEYDWEGDVHPQLSYENSVIYRLHPRGFTRHSSSKVKARGTFAGITEKIPYLQELGITTVELLPCIEFDEVIPEDKTIWKLDKKFEKFLEKSQRVSRITRWRSRQKDEQRSSRENAWIGRRRKKRLMSITGVLSQDFPLRRKLLTVPKRKNIRAGSLKIWSKLSTAPGWK